MVVASSTLGSININPELPGSSWYGWNKRPPREPIAPSMKSLIARISNRDPAGEACGGRLTKATSPPLGGDAIP